LVVEVVVCLGFVGWVVDEWTVVVVVGVFGAVREALYMTRFLTYARALATEVSSTPASRFGT
jgi:hypothetical protein